MTDPTVAYGALSYWHDTAPMRAASRRIEPGVWFDVAILGAGYTGLWTAHHLLERDPSLQVALIEKEEVGFGASGRNGGFAMTKIGHSLHQMTRDHGVEQTLAVHEAAEGAVQGLAATVEREGIDCELRYGGLLTVATNDAQARKLGRELDAVDRLGLKTIRAMGGEEVQALRPLAHVPHGAVGGALRRPPPGQAGARPGRQRGAQGRGAVRAGRVGDARRRGQPGAGRHRLRADLRQAGRHRHERVDGPQPARSPAG